MVTVSCQTTGKFALCFLFPLPPPDQYLDFHHKKENFPLQDICFVPDLLKKKGGRGPPRFFLICTFFTKSHTRKVGRANTKRTLDFFPFPVRTNRKNFFPWEKQGLSTLPPPLSLGDLLDRAKGIIELLFKWRERREKTAYIGPLCQMERHKFSAQAI